MLLRTQTPAQTRIEHPNLTGSLWGLCAVFLFALIYLSGKLSGGHVSALQIMWLRYLGGLLTISVFLLVKRHSLQSLKTRQASLHFCRAAAGGFSGVAAVYAATHMPVASASAVGLLDGLFTVVLGAVLLKEHVSVKQWLATILCLGGALLVVRSQGAFNQWDDAFAVPAGVALGGAFLVAVESILIKTLARSEQAVSVLFYVNLFGCLILALPGIMNWQNIELTLLFAFLMLGPLALLAQLCNIMAFRAADASVIGPLRYTWIIYSTLFGAVLFYEAITVGTWMGIALILAGGVWLALLRNPNKQAQKGDGYRKMR